MLYAGIDVHKKFSGYSMYKRRRNYKKRKNKTNEKEIREFFYGLRNVKVAIATFIFIYFSTIRVKNNAELRIKN